NKVISLLSAHCTHIYKVILRIIRYVRRQVPLQKVQNKHVNIWIMNKRQNLRGECTNIIKLFQIID
ncbi:MAG: hypothetical protein ABFC34_08450, partial [Methanobacterium sp.]